MRYFFTFLILSLNTLAQLQIPDEINVEKYREIYLNYKAASDQDYVRAQEGHQRATAVGEEIRRSESFIVDGQRHMRDNDRIILDLQRELPLLRQDNHRLRQELRRHDDDIQAFRRYRGEVEHTILNLRAQLQAQTDVLDRSQQRLASAQRDLQNVQQQKQDLLNQKNVTTSEIARLERELQQKNNQKSQLETERQNLSTQLQGLRANRTQIQQQLQQAQASLPSIQTELQVAQQQLTALQTQRNQIQNEVNQLQAQRTALVNQIEVVQSQLAALEQKLRDYDQTRAQLLQKIQQSQSRIADLQGQISNAQASIQSLDQEIEGLITARQIIDKKNEHIATAKENFNKRINIHERKLKELEANAKDPDVAKQIAQEQAALKKTLNDYQSLLKIESEVKTEMASNIQSLQRARLARNQAQSRLQQLQRDLTQEQQALAQAQSALNNLGNRNQLVQAIAQKKQQLQALEQQLAPIQQALQQKVNALTQIQQQITAQTNVVQQKSQQLTNLQAQISQLQTQLQNVSNQISQKENRVANINQALVDINRDLPQLAQQLQQQRQRLNALNQQLAQLEPVIRLKESRVQDIHRDHQVQVGIVQQTRRELDSFERELQNVIVSIRDLQNAIEYKGQALRANLQTIESHEIQMSNLNNENVQLAQEIREAELNIISLKRDEVALWGEYQVLNNTYQASLERTNTAKNHFESVQQRYATLLRKAQDRGSQDADQLAYPEGQEMGEERGLEEARLQGVRLGTSMAKYFSQSEGLTAGLSEGKLVGLNEGKESKDHYDLGFDRGLQQGKKDAHDESMRIDYPQARAEKRREFLSQIPQKIIQLSNQHVRVESLVQIQESLINQMAQRLDVNEDRLHGQQDVEELFLKKISDLQNLQAKVQKDYEELLDLAGEVTPPEINVDDSQANCQDSWIDFTNACLASFRQQYKKSFIAGYQESYAQTISDDLPLEFRSTFERLKSIDFEDSKQEAFEALYSKYFKLGTEMAQENGFLDGQRQAYDQEILAAKARAREQGTRDEEIFFNTSAVVKVPSIELIPKEGGFYPGKKVDLKLRAINFGKKASLNQAIQLRLRAISSNLKILNRQIGLTSVPERVQADIFDLADLTLSESLKPGEKIKLEVQVLFEDGKVETHLIETQGEFYIQTNLELDYDKNPTAWGWIGEKKTITIRATLANKGPHELPRGVRMELRSKTDGVDITKAIDTDSDFLPAGKESKRLFVRYRIDNKDLKNRPVTLEVLFFQGESDQLIRSEEIVVIPKS